MRRVVAIMIALVIVMSGVAISSPAEALPSGCSHWLASDGRAYARCSSGSGYYRVGLNCRGPGSLFYDFTHWGQWARVGSGQRESIATCPLGSGSSGKYSFLEKRDSI